MDFKTFAPQLVMLGTKEFANLEIGPAFDRDLRPCADRKTPTSKPLRLKAENRKA